MKKIKIAIYTLLFSTVLCMGFGVKADAAAVTLQVQGMRMYQEVQKIFNEVNAQRAKDGKNALILSEQLTQAAMQRAAECAAYYSHTRPNGQQCSTVVNDYSISWKTCAENIAAGQTSASQVMNDWMNSKGHQENILRAEVSSIGIGCFLHNGTYYWVQLFTDNANLTRYTEKNNANNIAYVNLIPEQYSFQFVLRNVTSPMSPGTIPVGGNGYLQVAAENPGVKGRICLFNAGSFTWSSSNSNVLSFDSGAILGKEPGSAMITAAKEGFGTLSGTFYAKYPLAAATVSGIEASYPRTGRPVIPAIRVVDSTGKTLVQNIDYKIKLEDNTWGPGKVTISGIGNCDGSIVRSFTMYDPDIDATKEAIVTMQNRSRGASETVADYLDSVVTVTYRGTVLENGIDYFIKNGYYNSIRKAYSFTIDYRNAYVGYQNCDQLYEDCMNDISDQVYTGKAITPYVSLKMPAKYSVTYLNNVNPGIATVVVKGDGINYIGQVTKTFRIVAGTSGGNNTTGSGGSTGTGSNGGSSSSNNQNSGTTPVRRAVAFKANGGKASASLKTVVSGKKLGTLPGCKRKGYTFTGWYSHKTKGKKVSTTTVIKKNTVLYAHWLKGSVPKVSVKKLTAGSKKLKVTINKGKSAKGYQIRYALKSNMKGAKYTYTKGTSKTITKLAKKKNYYIQVRAYRLDTSGIKIFWKMEQQKKPEGKVSSNNAEKWLKKCEKTFDNMPLLLYNKKL